MLRTGRALLRSIVVGLAFAGLATGATAQQKFINILTGGQSGVYYPLGVALGAVYGKAMPDTKSSVQATKASVENLNLLQEGKGELAFTLGDSLASAIAGNKEAGFPAPPERGAFQRMPRRGLVRRAAPWLGLAAASALG